MPEYLLKTDDIVFGRKGAVERSAQVQAEEDGYFLGSDGIRVRLNSDSCHPKFIAYQLQSVAHKNWMVQHAAGTTMPSLNEGIIRRIPITFPPLPEQKAIAHILGSLDDKIELNRRMNATLEGMAQALFKSWFTDFDPVIDNILMKNMIEFLDQNQPSSPLLPEGEELLKPSLPSLPAGEKPSFDAEQSLALWERLGEGAFKGIPDEFADRAETRRQALADFPTIGKTAAEFSSVRKLFPDSFQTSELGPIPTGWDVTSIDDIASVIKGKSYKSSELKESKTALVTLKSFKRGGGYRLDGLKEYIGDFKPEQVVHSGDLIIAYTDVTQDADVIGKPAMVIENSKYETQGQLT